jgi:hypothetical protein
MERVQIVLDKDLLEAADKAARQMKQNRSALIRHALREHLRRLEALSKEERDRAGYSRRPQALEEASPWEEEAAWPVNLHNTITVCQDRLGKRVTRPHGLRMKEICVALRFSLGCDLDS